MKLYQITIRPQTPFGTSLKGDTLFGHFCWQAAYDRGLLNGGLDSWIERYPEKPFAIFSSAFPLLAPAGGESENSAFVLALPRPQLPAALLAPAPAAARRERLIARKRQKKQKWLLVDEQTLELKLDDEHLADDRELYRLFRRGLPAGIDQRLVDGPNRELALTEHHAHNAINRLTNTTGKEFAPYQCSEIVWPPGLELAFFVLAAPEALGEAQLETGLGRIGAFGFGRDAGTGRGRFEITGIEERGLPIGANANACYTLAPAVPEAGRYRQLFYTPFTRFGRHGDRLARSANPFKAPIVMADEGAVLVPTDPGQLQRPWLGRALTGISRVQPETVAQGYTIYIPCEVAV